MSYEYNTPGADQEFTPPKSKSTRNCCLFAAGGCGCLTVIIAVIIGVSTYLVFNNMSGFIGTTVNVTLINNALERYCMENGTYPPAYTVDENGQPLHSWRVLILPYLAANQQNPFDKELNETQDLKALYESIRLDEPWDSEYNKQFASKMPRCYLNATLKEEGKTSFKMIIGPKCVSDGPGTRTAAEVRANRPVVIIEANPSVEWMKPEDLQYTDLETNGFVEPGSPTPGVICPHSFATFPFGLAVVAGAEPGVYSSHKDIANAHNQHQQFNANNALTLERIRQLALFENEIGKAAPPDQEQQQIGDDNVVDDGMDEDNPFE